MKLVKYLLSCIAACATTVFYTQESKAQLISGDVFLQGDYAEVGIAPNGSFGSVNDCPIGYHTGRSGFGIPAGNAIGFVADPDKDGWLVSAGPVPGYIGDYFLPGTPYEGWDVQYTGTGVGSGRRNIGGGTGFTGGATGANTGYTATATERIGVWQGSLGNLAIKRTTVLKKDKLYFVMYVELTNTGTTPITNLYYYRGVDPDNEQTVTGNFATFNKVIFQPNPSSKNCLVQGTGTAFPSMSYLGLGTKDCRAKACIVPLGSWPPNANLADIYNQTGIAAAYLYPVGSTVTSDAGIGVVFNLGNLAPGAKTSLAYTYILKEADLDSALAETAPKFESNGTPYASYTTFRVCPGKTVPLKVIGGGQYTWIWTPSTNMLPVTGTTIVGPGGTLPATGSYTYPSGGAQGDSVLVEVKGPMTYVARGISNCDTFVLTFYVDTLSFAIAPAVTSPVRYCEGATATALTATGATGATLRWYTTPVGGTPSLTAPTPSTSIPAGGSRPFDTTRYYVSQVNAAGCETPRAEIQVIITEKPAPPKTEDLVYCVGEVADPLTAAGQNLGWYDAATAGTKYTSVPVPSTAVATTLSYFASQTVNGCESDRQKLSVLISQATASFVAVDDSLCGTQVDTFVNNSGSSTTGGIVSAWDFGDGTLSTDSTGIHAYNGQRGDYKVKLVVKNLEGCTDSVTKIIHVFPQPEISFLASDSVICQGNAIQFSGAATPGYYYLTWDFGDGTQIRGGLQERYAFAQGGTYNVQFKGAYPACNVTSAGKQVKVINQPNVNLGNDTSVCPGSNVVRLRNLDAAAGEKYTWSTGDTTASVLVRHEGTYWVKVRNGDCVSADSITVTKGCYIDIPNAFTPGAGSDIDGYFLPRQLLSKSVVSFDMKIFDRWGQLIYETNKTQGRGWDGNYNGHPMPFGVYVYLIRVSFANGVTENYQGNITLIR